MAVGNYFTTASPTDSLGFMVQAESRVRVGTQTLYGSLETTSWTYTTYGASIGVKTNASIDLGQVDSLGFTHQPNFEPLESANIQQPSIYVLTGEETSVSVGLRQFDPRVLEFALGTGSMYSLGNERLITFGGACNGLTRPLEIGVTNIGCSRPTAANINNGITGIVLTLYDTQVTSGVDWGDIVATEVNVLDLEFTANPVLSKALGNRLGNLYIF